MRIPLEWLKEYLPDLEKGRGIDYKGSAKEIAEVLTMSGTETELLSESFEIDPNVVVGEILEINPHPNADRLRIPKVRISSQPARTEKVRSGGGSASPYRKGTFGRVASSQLDIVCGASNIEVGQKVPVALVGTKFGDFEIKEAEIRGVKSLGMICSEQELGIAEHSEGIMVLEADAKVGTKLSDLLKSEKDILEAELTPNRGDCLSMIGIAEEIAAVQETNVKNPSLNFKESRERTQDILSVEVKEKDLCPRYIGRIIKIKQNGESPKWMQERLESYGIRPISAIVDITNYVMVELGQPMHAFDFDKIKDKELLRRGKNISVRLAKDGEEIITLDKIKRKLTAEDLVITDSHEPIAVAGVMGGQATQVDENTKIILLESATFDKTRVRKTAQRLNLRSESSSRFEKGIPLELNFIAMKRACSLFQEVCGGEIFKGQSEFLGKRIEEKKVLVNVHELSNFLGEIFGQVEVRSILKRLGFEVRIIGKEGNIEVQVPWWRLDIAIKEDIYEEVARIYGYNKIKSTLPKGEIPKDETSPIFDLLKKLRLDFAGKGFTEMYNYSFISKEWIQAMGDDEKNNIRIANPISGDLEYMRTSLVPSLLSNVAKNQLNFSEIRIFEVARIYEKAKALAKETMHLTGAVLGGETSGIKYREGKEFYIAKGAIASIVSDLGAVELKVSKLTFLHPGRSADIFANGEKIGFVGEVNSLVAKKFGIKKRTAIFDIDLEKIQKIGLKEISYIPFSRFPAISRDLNFVVEGTISILEITKTLNTVKSDILTNYVVKDIFEGKEMNGKKSVTINFSYQTNDRTLSDEEVVKVEKEIIKIMKTKLNGELR